MYTILILYSQMLLLNSSCWPCEQPIYHLESSFIILQQRCSYIFLSRVHICTLAIAYNYHYWSGILPLKGVKSLTGKQRAIMIHLASFCPSRTPQRFSNEDPSYSHEKQTACVAGVSMVTNVQYPTTYGHAYRVTVITYMFLYFSHKLACGGA